MIDTAGSDATARVRAAAFTLVEVLLVIGMMVLITAAAGLWVQRGMFATENRPPQEVFLNASAQARVLSMQQGKPVLLSFDETAQGFRLSVVDAESPGGKAVAVGNLPWQEDNASGGFWRFARSVVGGTGTGDNATAEGNTADGSRAGAGQTGRFTADTRFFALSPTGRMRVTFNLLYGEENTLLPLALDGIRYHPSGASAPVQVRMEDTSTGFKLVLLPDHLSSGLRLDDRASALTNGGTTGGWQ